MGAPGAETLVAPGWEEKSGSGMMGPHHWLPRGGDAQHRTGLGYGHPRAVTASVPKGQQGTRSQKDAEPAAGSGPAGKAAQTPEQLPVITYKRRELVLPRSNYVCSTPLDFKK